MAVEWWMVFEMVELNTPSSFESLLVAVTQRRSYTFTFTLLQVLHPVESVASFVKNVLLLWKN